MRKWWQNVNRGMLLLLIAIIAVVSYLVADSLHNRQEKKKLKEITSQYISDSSPLFSPPKDFDFFSWNGEDTDLLLPAMYSQADPIEHYYVDNEMVRHQEIDKSLQFFRYYYALQLCPVSCMRIPTDIEITQIYNGSATVVVHTVTKIGYLSSDGSKGVDERNSSDTLLFLNTDGEWKLVQVNSQLYNLTDV